MTEVKSCLNCIHVHTWDYPASLHSPPDSGWECNNPNIASLNEDEPYEGEDDEGYAIHAARNCNGYEYNTPPTHEQMESYLKAEEEMEKQVFKDVDVFSYLQSLPEDSVYRKNADLYLDDNEN